MTSIAPARAARLFDRLTQSRSPWLLLLAAQLILVMLFTHPWLTSDSPVYLRLAEAIGTGHYGLPSPSGWTPDPLRPPGYPLLLWAFPPLQPAWLIAVQLGLYLAALVVADTALPATEPTRPIFRLFTLIYPFAAFYCGVVMTEAWATIGFVGAAILLSSRLSPPRLVITGLVLGAVALVRSDMALLPLLAALIVAVRTRSWSWPAIPVLAAAIVLTPYAVWNHANFGRWSPVPVASAVGNSLYLATWQGELQYGDLMSLYRHQPTPAARQSGLVAEVARINASFGADPAASPWNPADYPTLDQQIASSAAFGHAALDRIADRPGAFARHLLGNAWALWNTTRYPGPPILAIPFRLISALVLLLGFAGAAIAFRRASPLAAAAAFLFYPMLVHLPLHTEARYTAAARPLLLMFAAIAVAVLWTRLRGHRLDDREVEGQRL